MSATLPVRPETQMRAYDALDALSTIGMDSLVNLALDALDAITLDGRDDYGPAILAVRERYADCLAGSHYCESSSVVRDPDAWQAVAAEGRRFA